MVMPPLLIPASILTLNIIVASNPNLENFKILWNQAEREKEHSNLIEAQNIYKLVDNLLTAEPNSITRDCISEINKTLKTTIKKVNVGSLKCNINLASH